MDFFTFWSLNLQATSRWSGQFLPSSGALKTKTMLKYWDFCGVSWYPAAWVLGEEIVWSLNNKSEKDEKGLTTTLRIGTGLDKEITGLIPGVARKAEDVSWDVSWGWGLREGCGSVSRCIERKERRGSALLVHSHAAHPAWGSVGEERWGSRATELASLPRRNPHKKVVPKLERETSRC